MSDAYCPPFQRVGLTRNRYRTNKVLMRLSSVTDNYNRAPIVMKGFILLSFVGIASTLWNCRVHLAQSIVVVLFNILTTIGILNKLRIVMLFWVVASVWLICMAVILFGFDVRMNLNPLCHVKEFFYLICPAIYVWILLFNKSVEQWFNTPNIVNGSEREH